MESENNNNLDFNLKLAIECSQAFSKASGLGCIVTDVGGNILYDSGFSCRQCNICALASVATDTMLNSHLYGMHEAERFGGKYIYFCPMGLSCFVSPILGSNLTRAKITVGPFLMVDYEDYIEVDLKSKNLSAEVFSLVESIVKLIPIVDASKVNSLSTLLFMSVGFMNNVYSANKMLDKEHSDKIQSEMSDYIRKLKGENITYSYPIDIETKLLRAIAESNKTDATRYLNELLGSIFFGTSGDLTDIRSKVYELLILISRSAITAGADSDSTLSLNRNYLAEISAINQLDELCVWLTHTINKQIDNIFNYPNIRHSDIIHKTMHFIRQNYEKKITLEDAAKEVYLSASYLSKIFKDETGTSFNRYLNNVRIEKSKTLLLSDRIRLTDISVMVGFEDQSYYTKVFKRTTGILPSVYREKKGKI